MKTSTRIAAGVAALITALSLSACSSAPVDPDRHACEGIATWERLNVEGRLDDLDRRRLDEMDKRLRALEGAAK